MTGREIYKIALLLLFEGDSADYETAAPVMLRILLSELFWMNNQIRKLSGRKALEFAPTLESMEEEIPYEEAICREALPWGLAANLLLGDEEEARSANYFTKYAQAVGRIMKFSPEPIRDVY